jgi:hypothetical protein
MAGRTMKQAARRWSLLRVTSWYAAHVRGCELDEILAEGIEPDTPATRRLCEARARLLARHSFRFTLAQEIEDLIQLAARPRTDPSLRTVWTVDVQLDEVRQGSEILQQIARALRTRTPPRAQGHRARVAAPARRSQPALRPPGFRRSEARRRDRRERTRITVPGAVSRHRHSRRNSDFAMVAGEP